jgi:hypothetical protein
MTRTGAYTSAPRGRRRSSPSTPWEAEVIGDRRDVDEFKEASCMIERVLVVRVVA